LLFDIQAIKRIVAVSAFYFISVKRSGVFKKGGCILGLLFLHKKTVSWKVFKKGSFFEQTLFYDQASQIDKP